MDDRIKAQAADFIANESQFHLGFLPTEQSNPKTRGLEKAFAVSAEQGVRCLQCVDRDVLLMLRRVYSSVEYGRLVERGLATIRNGGRVIFSGCGATGRLSILLEAMWRNCCALETGAAKYADSVESIMTGGDYALVRSVEFFEDYASFGRRQVEEARMTSSDMLVAITEGGETSSVLGSVDEAVERGCAVFLLFNNPADVLASHLERSRKAIEDPRVCVLDLYCGPMALAGSTRMQATTAEQMVAGAALESIMHTLIGCETVDYAEAFVQLLDSLESNDSVNAIAGYMRFEADVYRNHGKLTYFADRFLLDIFTDTTERSPTFMLPMFRKCDDTVSPAPWTFVKNPLHDTVSAWNWALRRPLRCLDWTLADYAAMGAAGKILSKPPALSADELRKFQIGCENPEERSGGENDAAVLVTFGAPSPELESSFMGVCGQFARVSRLGIDARGSVDFDIEAVCAGGALELMRHIALKLVLNTISTGAMALLGRISGNWMSWVDCTNKKLLDRGTRLLVELAGVDYRTACESLFEAVDFLDTQSGDKPSPVQLALGWLRRKTVTSLREYLESMDRGWKLKLGNGTGPLTEVTPREMLSSNVRIAEDGRSALLTWRGHRTLGQEFMLTVSWEWEEDGRFAGRLAWSGYEGTAQIEEVCFPVAVADFDDASQVLQCHDTGYLLPASYFSRGVPRFISMASMNFMAVCNRHGGCLYLDCRDANGYLKCFHGTRAGDYGDYIEVEASWQSPLDGKAQRDGAVPYECTVRPYAGGWFDAAQFYRPWALRQKWWLNATKNNPLRDIGMWVWNRGLIKDVIPPVERLQEDLGEARVALDWYWWHSNPYDTDYPNFWPPREGEDAFKAAVAGLNARGIYSQVYVNGVCWDHDGRNWDEGGAEGVIVNRDGTLMETAFNKYNHHRLAYMCGEASKYHERLAELVRKLRECGLTGQYLDMIGCATYHPCYNPAHKHHPGGGHYVQDGFHKMVTKIAHQNPGYVLTTETATQNYMDLFDGGIICGAASCEHLGGTSEPVPAFMAVFHGRFATFGNYAHPDGIPPWDPKWPDEDRWKDEKPWHKLFPDQFFVEMARPVVWGAQPMVCQLRPDVQNNPEFAEIYRFMVETGKFYYAHREWLFDGDMMSPEGFSCGRKRVEFLYRMIFTTAKASHVIVKYLPCILHGYWRSPAGQYALILANYTADEQPWCFRGKSGSMKPHTYECVLL